MIPHTTDRAALGRASAVLRNRFKAGDSYSEALAKAVVEYLAELPIEKPDPEPEARPKPPSSPFPFFDHRTMAEVLDSEEQVA